MHIYFDSTSAIKLGNNLVYHDKKNHVEVDCYFIREKKIEKEDVLLIQVSTEDQLVDFLTKAFNKAKLHFVMSKLSIVNIYALA